MCDVFVRVAVGAGVGAGETELEVGTWEFDWTELSVMGAGALTGGACPNRAMRTESEIKV